MLKFKLIYILSIIVLLLNINDVYAFKSTDLSDEGYKDMYASKHLTGEWVCLSYRYFLLEDDSGIKSISAVSPAILYLRFLKSQTLTTSLYYISVILNPGTTSFNLQVTTNNSLSYTLDVKGICEIPPTPDIEFINGDNIQFDPSHTISNPYFLMRIKNYNKIIPPVLFVTNSEGVYNALCSSLTNNIYYVTLLIYSGKSLMDESNFEITVKNGVTLYHKTRSLASRFDNHITYNSFYIYPFNGTNEYFYPEVYLLSESIYDNDTPTLKMYDNMDGYQRNAPLVIQRFGHGVHYRKYGFRSYSQITLSCVNYAAPFPNYMTNTSIEIFLKQPISPTYSNLIGNVSPQDIQLLKYTTNAKYQTDELVVNAKRFIQTYPFSYTSGNSLSYLKVYEFYINSTYMANGYIGDQLTHLSYVLTPIEIDSQAPTILSIETFYLPNKPIMVLKMGISDNLSGFSDINFGDNRNLISGTLNNGIYEFVFKYNAFYDFDRKIRLQDRVLNFYELSDFNDIYVNTNLQKLPFNFLDLSKITKILFEKNDLDTSGQTIDNHMFIYSDQVDKTIFPTMYVLPYGGLYDDLITYSGIWNDHCGCYIIPFTVPMNYPPGIFEYLIAFKGYAQIVMVGDYLVDLLGPDAGLRVKCKNTDLLGPMVIEINTTAPIVQVPHGVGTVLTWDLKVIDHENGYNYGLVSIIGSLDLVRYNFTLNYEDRTDGDEISSYFTLEIPVNGKCKSQSFYIQYAYFEDQAGYFSEYMEGGPFSLSGGEYINPFVMMYNTTNDSLIEVVCQNAIEDTVPPVLDTFSFSPNFIDSFNSGEFFNKSRTVTFTLTTSDLNGILLSSNPRIYLTDRYSNLVFKDSELVSFDATTANYKCLFEIPFGFGFGSEIKVSIFGIVDNQSNFNGYSISQLELAGFQNTISVESQLTFNTSILSTEKLYRNGGDIVVIGRNFKNTNSLIVNFNNGTIITLSKVLFNTNSVIMFNIPGTILVQNITITIQNGNTFSNSLMVPIENKFIISPVFPPSDSSSSSGSNDPPVTNKPQTCINNCGGIDHGVCTDNGCVCKSPWIGLYCLSQVIVIDPVINTTTPSTNITVPTNDKNTAIYYAIISVIALNELDKDKQLFKQHQFPQWIVNNNTISKYSQYTNSSYLYSSSFDYNNITTNINVSIDYFNVDIPVNITFASQIFTMNPYSLKYSVNISEYSFGSSLNTLQLVLLASIETEDNSDECSSKQFGDTVESDSEYIKMQVNDHSLYGRFIKRGVVDGRIKTISNVQLDNQYNSISTQSQIQSYIGINIPFYKKSVELDPDFSVLIDNKPASEDDNAVCSKEKIKLTKAQIAGIAIGSAAFIAIVVVAVSYGVYKSRQQKNLRNSLSLKMKEASGENK